MQTIKLIESNPHLKRAAFNLSRYEPVPQENKSTTLDLTWPFMCVSIMFTKEALKAMRSGALNSFLNQSQADDTAIDTLADFHQSCFFDFAKYVHYHVNSSLSLSF